MIIVDLANNTADKPEGKKTLTLLVRRYGGYRKFPGLYADFSAVYDAALTDATLGATNTKALNAVLAQLAQLPLVAADSEGSQDERIFFSVGGNWDELAQTVLDILYEPPGDPLAGAFVSARRGMPRWDDDREFVFLDERRWWA